MYFYKYLNRPVVLSSYRNILLTLIFCSLILKDNFCYKIHNEDGMTKALSVVSLRTLINAFKHRGSICAKSTTLGQYS